MKDYAVHAEETEEVVLTRWGKVKQWIEIVVATKKVAVLIWSLIFAAGGSVVVGQATDTKPIRDAAVALGILDDRAPIGADPQGYLDEILTLQEEVGQLEERIEGDYHEEMLNLQDLVLNLTKDVQELKGHEHEATVVGVPSHEHEALVQAIASHEHEAPGPAVAQATVDAAVKLHVFDDH